MSVERAEVELRSARSNLCGALACGFLVLFFCLVLLWRDPLVFWNDDYQISILPVFADVARCWNQGHWPILSPYSWVCGNLAGEYQYGTFSAFINAAVIVIWKIFHGFAHQAAALSTIHLIVLATGAFMLARQRGLSMPLATMVSLLGALNGWIICWGASDWFGALGAFAWIPWAWWGLEKALGQPSDVVLAAGQCPPKDHRQDADATVSRWRFLWPAPFVYLVATGGFPYTVGMLGVIVAWLTIRSLASMLERPRRRDLIRSVFQMLFGAALGLGLAAPALLALLAYVHGSAREAQPASAHWQWIVPPAALPGLIIPSWTVKWVDFATRYQPHTGTELACGLVAPTAILWGLITNRRKVLRELRWDLVLLGVVLMIAMLPTAGLFRWSFRWLPLFHLVLVLCGAETLRLLGQKDDHVHQGFGWMSPARIALALVAVTMLAMKLFGTEGTYSFPLMWIFLAIGAVWTLIELGTSTEQSPGFRSAFQAWMPPMITFAALLATYLCIPPNCGVPRYNFTEALMEPAPLDPARLYLSIYPPPEVAYRMEVKPLPVGQIVRPGSTSMWAKLHFINGYSPIRPAGVATRFYTDIHGEIDSGTAQWLLLQEAGPQGGLAQLGIDGITIAREMEFDPQPASEWELVRTTEEGRVFHRRGDPYPIVRSVRSISSRPDAHFVSARVGAILDSRQRIEADVEVPNGTEPALLSISRPYFCGYVARVDGTRLNVGSDRGLYPVVEIPAGSKGRLIVSYRPAWLVYGGLIALGSGALFLTSALAALRNSIKSRG